MRKLYFSCNLYKSFEGYFYKRRDFIKDKNITSLLLFIRCEAVVQIRILRHLEKETNKKIIKTCAFGSKMLSIQNGNIERYLDSRFTLKFFRVFSKNRQPGKFPFNFFHTRKVTFFERVQAPSSDHKMIKLLKFDNLIPPLRHSRS